MGNVGRSADRTDGKTAACRSYIQFRNKDRDAEQRIRNAHLWTGHVRLTGETCVDSVTAALASGVRLIDTAYMHQNEESVGEAVRNSGIPREEIFVITKLYPSQCSKVVYRPLCPELASTSVLAWKHGQPFSLAATKFISHIKCFLGMEHHKIQVFDIQDFNIYN